jgi:hypothetical protein
MAKRLDKYIVVVAGITAQHTYFAASCDDDPNVVQYFRAPVVKGVERFDGQLLAVLESLAKGAELPEGFQEVAVPDEPFVKRALRHSKDPLTVLGPVRWKGEHVSLVAVSLGEDGKKQNCAIIEHCTGMSIRFVEGIKAGKAAARSAENYLKGQPALQELLRGTSFGKAPDSFPDRSVRQAFLGLRKEADRG